MIEILLVNESFTSNLYTQIVTAIDEVCAHANSPSVTRHIFWNEREKADLTRDSLLDPECLILLGSFDVELTDHLDCEHLPWVALANGMHGELTVDAANYVHFDGRDCVAKAISYLLYLEHTSIALLANASSPWEQRLIAAYTERMQIEGLAEQIIPLRGDSDPYLNGLNALTQMSRIEPRPTALLIAGSEAAAGLWRAWSGEHAAAKQATSVFLLSGIPTFNRSSGYSQVAIPLYEMGVHLARMALRRRSDPDDDAESVFIAGRFIEGSTCWPLALPGMV